MNNKKINSQKGAISIFTVLSMIFFLVFVVGVFSFATRRNQAQIMSMPELKNIYKKDADAIYDSYTKENNGIIPIYGYNHFSKIGSRMTIRIDEKNYPFNNPLKSVAEKRSSYEIKNNITERIDKVINLDRYTDSLPTFNDYMVYSNLYNVENNGFEIYYKYNQGGEEGKYKLIAYSRDGKVEVSNTERTSNRFNILDSEININTDKYAEIQKNTTENTSGDVNLTDAVSYPVLVNILISDGSKLALVYGTDTVYNITKNNFTYWQGYNVVKSGDNYIVQSLTDASGKSKGDVTPPTDGYILFVYGSKMSTYKVNKGNYIVLDFDYTSVKEGNVKVLSKIEQEKKYTHNYTYEFDFLAVTIDSNGNKGYRYQTQQENKTLSEVKEKDPEIPKVITKLSEIKAYSEGVPSNAKGFYLFVRARK